MKKRIYIVGKISKLIKTDPLGVVLKFEKAAQELRKRGYIPINPIEVVNDLHCEWLDAMKLTIPAMLQADAALLLEDWTDGSEGSFLEVYLCEKLSVKTCVNINDLDRYFSPEKAQV